MCSLAYSLAVYTMIEKRCDVLFLRDSSVYFIERSSLITCSFITVCDLSSEVSLCLLILRYLRDRRTPNLHIHTYFLINPQMFNECVRVGVFNANLQSNSLYANC